MTKTNVVSIQTTDEGLPDAANMTPDELLAQFKKLQAMQRQMSALAKEMEKRNAGQISELEFEIFVYRVLARPYLKRAKEAYDKLRELQPERVKVVFAKKGKISEQYQPFIARFKKEIESFDDARYIADPEDLGVESVE